MSSHLSIIVNMEMRTSMALAIMMIRLTTASCNDAHTDIEHANIVLTSTDNQRPRCQGPCPPCGNSPQYAARAPGPQHVPAQSFS